MTEDGDKWRKQSMVWTTLGSRTAKEQNRWLTSLAGCLPRNLRSAPAPTVLQDHGTIPMKLTLPITRLWRICFAQFAHICITSSQGSTSSSSLVTLARPSTSSSLRITDRSFQYASPRLWNQLPASLRQPRTNLSNSSSPSSLSGTSSVLSAHHSHHPSPLHSFTPGLKPSFSANPSRRSLPFLLQDWLHELTLNLDKTCLSVLEFVTITLVVKYN